jgi:hypothetical protein
MTNDDAKWDDTFSAMLTAFDAQLVKGIYSNREPPPTDNDLPFNLARRLAEAQWCLLQLERIWPRAKTVEGAE